MANYYNVTGWKHTGFDYYNRPFSREVLNGEYFTSAGNYFQMNGVAVKRDDTAGLSYIDLQGSVKDERGTQVNPPNVTGVLGPGGPWYSWEEVDYIRLVRTGYPGDEDFVDISGHQKDPWNAPREGKLYVSYYFVTGMEARARNVTRIYLMLDEWTTMGGASELEIETGFKIRGHITEAEDASSYNLAPEQISLIEPLEVKSSGDVSVKPEITADRDIVVSQIDLTQYSEEQTVDAFVAQGVNGQATVFPAVSAVSDSTTVTVIDPFGRTQNTRIDGYGLFRRDSIRVGHNLSVLFSAGQLELQDSYTVPGEYVELMGESENGRINQLQNSHAKVKNSTTRDITGYPRKADYLFGQEVLLAKLTGEMCAQSFYDVADRDIGVWATLTPGGTPIARFMDIKGHPYLYDQCVKGAPWMKNAVVMQGASGSMWNQLNNSFAQQSQDRAVAENKVRNNTETARLAARGAKTAADIGISAGSAISSAGSVSNLFSGGKESWAAAQGAANAIYDAANLGIDIYAEVKGRQFKEQSLEQAQNQLNMSLAQANFQAPYANFVPDLNGYVFERNAFFAYVINTSAKDRKRLKNYFLRYGYNGLYKPLTWDEVNVKSRVNYIQCEGVCLKHSYYPMRMTSVTSSLLSQGLFLWNEKPNQAAFANNPDRA
jgi:hypothetical protein